MSAERPGRRVAVALSGGGRSLANLLEKQRPGQGYEIAGVVASRPDCGGVTIAKRAGLPLLVGDFSAAALPATTTRLYAWLAAQDIDWIALAGFLKRFPLHPDFVTRTVNIHPALLPDFGGPGMYGDRVHKAVLAARRDETGATVHFVTERYDEGAAIAQIVVPVRAEDSPQTLADRVFAAECRLYPHVLTALLEGRLPLAGGRIERLRHDEP